MLMAKWNSRVLKWRLVAMKDMCHYAENIFPNPFPQAFVQGGKNQGIRTFLCRKLLPMLILGIIRSQT
jgi:hypothetical protein